MKLAKVPTIVPRPCEAPKCELLAEHAIVVGGKHVVLCVNHDDEQTAQKIAGGKDWKESWRPA